MMKKVVSVILAMVMVVGMSVGVFAANAIKGIDTENFKAVLKKNGENSLILLNKKAIKVDKLEDMEITPGDELKIYLTADMFVDSAGKTIASQDKTPEYVSKNALRTGKVTMKRTNSSGSKAFSSIALKYDNKGAYICITFVKEYAATKPLDFSTKLYLYINGKRVNATGMTISGTMETETIEIYSDTDYIDLSDGSTAEAMEYVPSVEVDLGNGLTLLTSVSRGRSIYATSSTKVSNADAKIFDKYPALQEVVTISTLNMKKTGKPAKFDMDYKMYVYDAQGKYLGTTDQMLAYSTKYYLSDNKYQSLKIA